MLFKHTVSAIRITTLEDYEVFSLDLCHFICILSYKKRPPSSIPYICNVLFQYVLRTPVQNTRTTNTNTENNLFKLCASESFYKLFTVKVFLGILIVS